MRRFPLLAVVLVALAGCAAPAPGPTPVTDADGVEDITTLGALEIDATPFPDWITSTDQGVWVANVGPGLTRYDDEGATTAEVETGDIALAMEVGFGSLWAASATDISAELVRVDIADPEQVTRIPLPETPAQESSIAVTDDAVWVLTQDSHRLLRIDPATDTVAGQYDVAPTAGAVRGGFGALWLTRTDGVVDRIDPATGAVLAGIPVGLHPQFLAIGADAVWVMNQAEPSVSRIDPESGEVTTIELSGRPIDGGDIAASADAVWVRTSAQLAVRIDPQTLEITRLIGPPAGSGSIAIDGDAVWISAHDVTDVWRIAD